MLKTLKWILWVSTLMAFTAIGHAQVSGNLTAASTDCGASNSCIITQVSPSAGGATFRLSGTFVGTVQFEASADPANVLPANATWVAISATPSNSAVTVTSATAGGVWQVNVAGYQRLRMRVSAYTSGTIAALINLSTASARGGSGGGGGTIGGSIAAGQVAVGSGVNTISGSAALTALASGELDQTVNGTTASAVRQVTEASTGRVFAEVNDPTSGGTLLEEFNSAFTVSTTLLLRADGGFNLTSNPAGGAGNRATISSNTSGTIALIPGTSGLGVTDTGPLSFLGTTSGSASIGVAAIAGTPSRINLPIATGAAGTFFSSDGANPQQASWDARLVDSGTVLSYTGSGGIAAGPDGVHPGDISLVGNTTVVAPAANTFNLMGPSAATFTAYALQFPNAAPAANTVLLSGAPTSAVSQVTYGAVNLSSMVTGQLPISGVGSAGLSGTAPITISAAGAIACSTCVTSSTITFPVTVAGTVTSGGIPYFNSTTQASSSAILNTNILVKGGGAGGAPTNSSITDNGTTISSAELVSLTVAGSASNAALTLTGTPFAGTGTTSFPLVYLNGGTGPTTFSTSGTYYGINAVNAFGGNFMDYHVNGGASVYKVDASGNVTTSGTVNAAISFSPSLKNNSTGSVLIFTAAPTIAGAGCGGSAASIAAHNGTASFTINVGTAPTSGGCTVTLPAASTAWNCSVNDKTTISTAVSMQKQTGADSTTSVTFQNFSDITVATAPVANDIYSVSCFAR